MELHPTPTSFFQHSQLISYFIHVTKIRCMKKIDKQYDSISWLVRHVTKITCHEIFRSSISCVPMTLVET